MPRALNPHGFTFIELLATLALLAVALCFCLPISSAFHKKNQTQVIIDEIKQAIELAKTEALLTGDRLILTSLTENDWSSGMVLFKDTAPQDKRTPKELLHKWQWQTKGIRLTWYGFQSKHYLLFTPEIGSNTVNGYFLLKNALQQQYKLVVNRLGRVKEERVG